jgi:hypothetical protein
VVAGVVLGLVTVACGPLYHHLGGEAYAVMVVLALTGAASALLLQRRWHGERVVGPIEIQAPPQRPGAEGETVPDS